MPPTGQDNNGSQDEGTGGQQQEWKPPESQAEFDRIIQDRLKRHKPADYDDLVERARRLDDLELELSSDKDKAVAEAKREAQAEATPRVVRAEFRAAAKGVLSGEQLEALLEDLDLTKYVTGKGDVDEAKVERKVKAFAPKQGEQKRGSAGFGQGQQQSVRLSAREQGAAEAAKRFGIKTA